MTEPERERLALAALLGGIATPWTYMGQRMFEWALGEHGNPALVLRTLHTTYFWRVAVALWAGALLAGIYWVWLGRGEPDAARRARSMARWALVVVPLAALATWRFP